jgi:hypothetical protein
MKIWTDSSSTAFTFCDHGREGPSNFVPKVIRNKDVLRFVQSAFAGIRQRGNTYQAWSFTVRREHANVTAAQDFLLCQNSLVPASGRVWIELDDQATVRVVDAVVDIAPAAPVGVLTIITYTLTFPMVGNYVPPVELASIGGIELNASDGTELNSSATIQWENGNEEVVEEL